MRAVAVSPAKTRRTGCEPSERFSTTGKPALPCPQCRDLDRVFRFKLTKYVDACAAAFYRVSKEFAAKSQVDMERAKNDVEEHMLVCASRMSRLDHVQHAANCNHPLEQMRNGQHLGRHLPPGR